MARRIARPSPRIRAAERATGASSTLRRVGMTCWMMTGIAVVVAVGVFVVLIARPLLIP